MSEVQLTFEWDACEAPKPPSDAHVSRAATACQWDFKRTFPPPRPEALAAGLLGYDEVDDEIIRGVHDEEARHVLALLRDLDILAEANRTQTDPFTGKKPRTEKQRARLREMLTDAPKEVQRELDEAMDAYANVFGEDAAEAFRATLTAWHHDNVPNERSSSDEAQTASFGNATFSEQYDSGHPWHYLAEGDGATPMPAEQIPTGTCTAERLGVKIPSNPRKRTALLEKLLAKQKEELNGDIDRYNYLLARGPEALSRYDREIAYGGNDHLAVASTIALKFNHIANAKGRVAWLEKQIEPGLLGCG